MSAVYCCWCRAMVDACGHLGGGLAEATQRQVAKWVALAAAPPRMSSAMLHDLANVARLEGDLIAKPFAWPPRDALSDDERVEVRRLDATERAIRYRAYEAEYEEQEDRRPA